jgi:hypothetical protein
MTCDIRLALALLLSAAIACASGLSATAAAPSVSVQMADILAGGDRHADPELEALLPTNLGGVVLMVESQSGTDLATKSGAFDEFLKSLGKTRTDFSVASAYATGGLRAEIGAWRVKGADPALMLRGFKTALQSSSTTPLTLAEETVNGRAVTRIGDPGQLAHGPLYVVSRDDTLLFVQTPEATLAEEAIGKLSQ